MAATIEHLKAEVLELRKEVDSIKDALEERELSQEAKTALEEARKTPESEYIDLE